MKQSIFSVAVTRPFRLDYTAWVLRRRAQNTISRWDGHVYQRVLPIGNTPVRVSVAQGGTPSNPRLEITLESYTDLDLDQQVEAQLMTQKMLGATVDLKSFEYRVADDPAVWDMVVRYLGVKPTRFPTEFEALISAVACQDMKFDKFDVAIQLLNRLSERFGLAFDDGVSVMHAFPRPEDLMGASEAELRQMGYSADKARIIMGLSVDVLKGKINLALLELMDNGEVAEYLSVIPGLSRWAVEYIMIRGYGRLDVLPSDERVANSLKTILNLKELPKYNELKVLSAAWHPFEGFIYFHLLLERLRANGLVS
jgi:DNA-3-methyladenine glycosylase II